VGNYLEILPGGVTQGVEEEPNRKWEARKFVYVYVQEGT
jgi:hypothetical protein